MARILDYRSFNLKIIDKCLDKLSNKFEEIQRFVLLKPSSDLSLMFLGPVVEKWISLSVGLKLH